VAGVVAFHPEAIRSMVLWEDCTCSAAWRN
jgi:hypothetical protein